MKKFTLVLTMIFGLYFLSNAQTITCNSNVNVTVDGNGEAIILPDYLLQGPNNGFDSFSVDMALLNCDDLGLNTIEVTGYIASNPVASCFSDVYLEDKLPPVPYVYSGVVVYLDGNGSYTLEVADLDAGSFDNCGNLNYTMSPAVITCGMPNPVTVTMSVIDDSGNSDYAVTNVYYEEGTSYPMVCQGPIDIAFPSTTTYEVTVDEILEGYNGNCSDAIWLELEDNGVTLPDNILTPDMYGSTIVATLHGGNGNSCWTSINVIDLDCQDMLDASMVTFPVDVTISDLDCEVLTQNLTPDFMINLLGLDSSESVVVVDVSGTCLITGYAYSDNVFVTPDSTRIVRNWTVIEWVHGTIIEGVQYIDLLTTSLMVCDTLPWNTPLGDCASGHTDADIVEWPADITINNGAYMPSQLENASGVHPNDTEPQLDPTVCEIIYVDYIDIMIDNSPDPLMIERTWSLFTFSGTLGTYTQTITVDYDPGEVYCAFRKNGDVIPDVIMAPGFVTDDSGCVDLSAYSGDLVEPSRSGDPAEGLDLEDQLIMSKHLLGIDPIICPFLRIAGDINDNGIITTLDVVLHQRIIDGLYSIDPVWSFYDVAAAPNVKTNILKSENNLFNTFVGVKKGDLNDSYDLDNIQGNPNPQTDFVSTDEVINIGQSYRVELYNTFDAEIQGLNLSFIKDNGLKVKNILAPGLRGFSPENYFTNEHGITVNYIPQDLNDPVQVYSHIPLLILTVEATENGILSERLELVDDNKNLLVVAEDNTARKINLKWDDQIINKVIDTAEKPTFHVYPNPASDVIEISGVDQSTIANFFISDNNGRRLISTAQGTINISLLKSGFYIVGLETKDGKVIHKPFIKM